MTKAPAEYGPAWKRVAMLIRFHAKTVGSFSQLAEHLCSTATEEGLTDEEKACVAYASYVLRASLHIRGKYAGRRILERPRKGDPECVRQFISCYWWHAGRTGGSLWGPIMGQMMHGEEHKRADTFASVLRIALGLPMVAADAWAHALGKEVTAT